MVARRTLLAALLACALAPAGARAAENSGDGALSPDLAKLAQPSVQALSPEAQANLLDVAPSGPGSLVREGGRVLVNVRYEGGALERLGALEATGADVVASSRRYQTVTAAVAPAGLRALAALPGVGSVTASPAPVVHAAAGTSVAPIGGCEGGSAISEGVGQLGVTAAREAFGLRGAGVTVGILSDSFDRANQAVSGGPIATHAHEDTQSNDIPGLAGTCSGQQTPVDVLDEAPSTSANQLDDEGRGMLQTVHDVAPHAGLAFATAMRGETSFAQNIERLARPTASGGAGAKVIADDVSYFEEPFFQDGPIANAISKVVSEGATYLTAAGNENLFQNELEASEGEAGIASWEAPEFRDSATCPAPVQETLVKASLTPHCMDFDPGAGEDSGFGFTVAAESELTVDLQWAEPWSGVGADLDAYLVVGGKIEAFADGNNIVTQKPVELLQWENNGTTAREAQLVINRCAGKCNSGASAAKPRLKFILMGEVPHTEYPSGSGGDVVGPTVYGHAASTSAIALGAVRFNESAAPEEFSSRGPATHYFGPVSGTTAAAPIAPQTIAKPDVVATDCGATTFFAQVFLGAWRFCGTSAAAPHAAGVAALMVQGSIATPAQIATALRGSALPVGGFGSDAVGAGLIDAKGALEAVGAIPTTADGPSATVPPLEAEPSPPVAPAPAPSPLPAPTPVAPKTSVLRHPPALVRTVGARARVVFRFGADQPGASFLCKLDRAPYAACGARLVRKFALGPHVVRVKARGASGLFDRTPAVIRFRVVSGG